LLAGLVSITACAPVVGDWMAIIVGAVGGVLYCLASRAVAWMLIDDVIDAFAVSAPSTAPSLLRPPTTHPTG